MSLKSFDTDVVPSTPARAEPQPAKAPWWREHLAGLVVGVLSPVASGLILWWIIGGR